jgi:hypothetical protein
VPQAFPNFGDKLPLELKVGKGTGWAVVGVGIGCIHPFSDRPYPATVIAGVPFMALILLPAGLVTRWRRGSFDGKSKVLLVGALLPVILMVANSIVHTPQAIVFVGG